jgi:hypothetical protein
LNIELNENTERTAYFSRNDINIEIYATAGGIATMDGG